MTWKVRNRKRIGSKVAFELREGQTPVDQKSVLTLSYWLCLRTSEGPNMQVVAPEAENSSKY